MTPPFSKSGAPVPCIAFWTLLVCAGPIHGCASTPRTATRTSTTTNADEFYQSGMQASYRGDDVRAEHYFALAMRNGYPQRPALLALLRLCLAGSRLRAALNYAEPYLRMHPSDAELRYLVATMYHGLGQTPAALHELDQVLASDVDHADAHFLSALLLHEGHFSAADVKRHLERYLALNPHGVYAYEARQLNESNEREIAMEVRHDSE